MGRRKSRTLWYNIGVNLDDEVEEMIKVRQNGTSRRNAVKTVAERVGHDLHSLEQQLAYALARIEHLEQELADAHRVIGSVVCQDHKMRKAVEDTLLDPTSHLSKLTD